MNKLGTIEWDFVAIIILTMTCEFVRIPQLKKENRKVEFAWTIIIYSVLIPISLIDRDQHHPLRLALLTTVIVLMIFRWRLNRKKNKPHPSNQTFPRKRIRALSIVSQN